MKLKDLLYEARIFQNNFIKLDIVEDEFKRIFGENTPKIEFDNDGMFIKLDTFTYNEYESADTVPHISLSDAGVVDEIKNIKKFYIEYTKPTETPETEPVEPIETPEV